ncbi:type I restriction enzyme HsdR N-terminal domain-containing protein, partial [bacterium]|nr:type I restriction enzyme HsdR N-terminal domain-containing protein [bacterium]
MAPLEETLAEIQNRISRYKTRQLNEQNTKATLIEPVLRALGWDVEDLEVVQREYKVKRRDKPVDYALFSEREPALFVEAKALGHDLNDRKWANQIMGYASVAGVPWIVLTNGDEYRIYNAHATVPVEKKLFRTVSVRKDAEEAASVLVLLDKSRMVESDLEHLWQSHYADQEVRTILRELFGSGVPDASLVSLVRKRSKGLSPKDVRASLARVRIELDFPLETVVARAVRPTRRASRAKAAGRKQPTRSDVSLKDLIAAGLIAPPLPLFRKYKGRDFSARVESDGRVTFGGEKFDAPSAAAGAARKTV